MSNRKVTPDGLNIGAMGPFAKALLDIDESPMKVQVGGYHYKDYAIQPYEFFFKNKIPHHKAAIIRRILRYDHPTGKGLEDLKKIMHEVQMIIELEGLDDTK